MDDSDYGILEESRRAAIRSAANLLEVADRAKRLRKRVASTWRNCDDDDGKDRNDRGDFMFDLLRLNASYLNQLAKIGEAHGHVAHRALEKLYALVVPSGRARSGEELVFTPHRRSHKFELHNDLNPNADSVTLTWATVSPPLLSRPQHWLSFLDGENVSNRQDLTLRLPFGASRSVSAIVRGDFPVLRKYAAELSVKLGRMRRGIPVVIDWREREPLLRLTRQSPRASFEACNVVSRGSAFIDIEWTELVEISSGVNVLGRWILAVDGSPVDSTATRLPVAFGESKVVSLEIRPDLEQGFKYEALVFVRDEGETRRIRVALDWT
jgi:hypothetical protein